MAGYAVLLLPLATTVFPARSETLLDRPADVKARKPVANPYCPIPTFAMRFLRGEARAILEDGKRPVILVASGMLKRRDYARFLLAHECCHHQRGHLVRLQRRREKEALAWQSEGAPEPARKRPNAWTSLAASEQRHQMELDADCCAAKRLAQEGDQEALDAARRAMQAFGAKPTGTAYPSGLQRKAIIDLCSNQ